MKNYILIGFRNPLTRQWRKPKPLNLFNQRLLTLLLFSFIFSQAFGQAFNLDQMANGKVSQPFPVAQPPASQWTWQNGNLNVNNAHFRESFSVPYRCDLTGLTPNTVYTLRIGIDVRVGGKFALDYFTGVQNLTPHGMFGHAAEKADPIAGLTFSPAPTFTDYALPVPSGFSNTPRTGYPAASFNALPAAADLSGQPTPKQIRLYNATVVTSAAADIVYENPSSVDLSATTAEAILRVTFRATTNHALIAWGGHIAADFDWPGQSAQFISGSPYHCHIRNLLDANGNELAKGSTDRSLKTDAVFRPPLCSLSADQTVCQGAASPLTYSYTGVTTGITNYKWVLTNGTTSPNVKIQGDNAAGDSDPAVGTVSGSSFSSVNIIPSSGTIFNTAGSFSLALTLTNSGGNSDPCSVNGTINPAATADAGSALTSCQSTTTQSVALTGASVGGGATSGTWSIVSSNPTNAGNTLSDNTLASGSLSVAANYVGVITLRLTTNDPDGPCPVVTADRTVTISRAATADAGADQTVCSSSPAVTLAGSVGGGASSGTWTTAGDGTFSPNATTLTAVYTPGTADIAAGSVKLTLTTDDPTGPCAAVSDDMTITISPRPGKPSAVVVLPLCTDPTMTVEVTLPSGLSSSATVTLRQMTGGHAPITVNASTAVNGKLTFTGLTFGKGYSITILDNVTTANPSGCTSLAEECGDFSAGVQQSTIQPTVIAQQIELNPQPTVKAYPNPYSDKVRFSVKSAVSGQGTLDLYNMLGQKVKTVFQGHVEAGQVQNVEYSVPNAQRSNLIYIFRVGDQKVTGKLLH